MSTQMKKAAAAVLAAALALTLCAVPVSADDGRVAVACNLSGADIYVDGALSGLVTDAAAPTAVTATDASHVTAALPGYTASYAAEGESVAVTLTPELYPAAYEGNVTTITVDNDAVTLESALNAVKNRQAEDEAWYVIYIPEGVYPYLPSGYNSGDSWGSHISEAFHHFTVWGGEGVTLDVSGSLLIYAHDARFVGVTFAGSGGSESGGVGLRTADDNSAHAAYDVSNIYFLGCTFTGFKETGVGNCGERGCAATAYGGNGTFNVTNLNYSACRFLGTRLFSFAGAGDEDYNVIDGYHICGNTFVDGGIGMLTADAHTWYVYGYDWYEEPAYCEYNILRNVLIAGNSITMTENGRYEYENIITIGCANLGNRHNLMEHVTIRSNTSRITGGDRNMFSAVSVCNVSVSDNYSEDGSSMDGYAPYMRPGLTHTDDNVTHDVEIYNNDFQLGTGRAMVIANVDVNVGEQCGQQNRMYDVRLHDNAIDAWEGVRICNYTGITDSGVCANNSLADVRFTGNTVTRSGSAFYHVGVLVTENYIAQHGHKTDDYPAYGGVMSNVAIADNTVTGYSYGIMAAGAAGDYGDGAMLSEVTITGNRVTTANWMPYPIVDVGIAVTGAGLAGEGEGECAHRPSRNCVMYGVKVTDNTVCARTGITVSGLLADCSISYPATGNRAEDVTLSGNTLTMRPLTEGDNQRTGGIVAADVIEIWFKLGYSEEGIVPTDTTGMVGGNRVSAVTVGENVVSGDFPTQQDVCAGGFHTRAGLTGDWQWLKNTAGDTEGRPFDRTADGPYAAKRALNDLWVYQTYDVGDGGCQLGAARESGGLAVDWSAKGALTCLAALYDGDGRLVALRRADVAAGDAAQTLHFAFSETELAGAASGQVFGLTAALAPRCPALTFTP